MSPALVWSFKNELPRTRGFIQFMRERGAEGEKLDALLSSLSSARNSQTSRMLDELQSGIFGR